MKTVNGKDLQIGDTVKVWWKPTTDTITGIRPYQGRYVKEEKWRGAMFLKFAWLNGEMTCFPYDTFEVVAGPSLTQADQ